MFALRSRSLRSHSSVRTTLGTKAIFLRSFSHSDMIGVGSDRIEFAVNSGVKYSSSP